MVGRVAVRPPICRTENLRKSVVVTVTFWALFRLPGDRAGAGLSDGNRHAHEDLPTLIAGSAGKTIKTGRRVVYRRETPMCNLFLGMMDRMGVHTDHFGDSTGKIDGLNLT
jgi:hypothetical protein